MKTYLVITLGTREIQIPKNKIQENNFEIIEEKADQFSKYYIQKIADSPLRFEVKQPNYEFPDYYTIVSPRIAGKIIDTNYALFRPIINFPIVRPTLEYLKQKEVNLDVIMLVYTDQEEAFKNGKVKFQNKENDSVYFADIISKLIKEDVFFANSEVDQFAIIENVTDLGFQYDDFKRINKSLLYPDEVKQVFLYPQGGIDQINQALVLRLIETFKGKVKQLQKAEGADFKELDFPSKFLEQIQAQSTKNFLNNYDFGNIEKGSASHRKAYHMSQYACKRLSLNYDTLQINTNVLNNKLFKNFIPNDSEKLIDLYISAKIALKQNKINEFLWKIFTLNENIGKVKVDELLGVNTSNFRNGTLGNNDKNERWENALNQANISIIPTLQSKNIWINNPSRLSYIEIIKILDENSKSYISISEKLELLSSKRHLIAHGLGSVDKATVNQVYGNQYNIDRLIEDLDKYFDIQGFGIYDKIKEEIEALL